MNENLLTTLTEISEGHTNKLEQHDQQISALQETMSQLSALKGALNHLTQAGGPVNQLLIRLPEQSNLHQRLDRTLRDTITALSRPQVQNHHHHFPKVAWATAGLFLILCLVSTGWYLTASRLGDFRDNDTKYRYLQLFDNSQLARLLHFVDSLQRTQPDFFRDSVLSEEEEKHRRLEMLDEATRKEAEAKQLRQRAE
ncbi:hypothetical protein ACWKWU_07365 [Chitinophaga lutea]